jgi:hypothetical protein
MIKSSLTSLAGIFVAREVGKGAIPAALSVPLSLLVARLPAPLLLLGAAGYGAYRLAASSRAPRATTAKPRRAGSRTALAKG